MPIFDYKCETCEHTQELIRKSDDNKKEPCPICKNESLVRQVGATKNLKLKGGGYYVTDFKNKN